jgi:hypothetical protein
MVGEEKGEKYSSRILSREFWQIDRQIRRKKGMLLVRNEFIK